MSICVMQMALRRVSMAYVGTISFCVIRMRKIKARQDMVSKAKENKNLIVGLDIGTSKIVAIVAEIRPEGSFEIIGMGSHPSRGLKKGVVVNIESTVNAIQR